MYNYFLFLVEDTQRDMHIYGVVDLPDDEAMVQQMVSDLALYEDYTWENAYVLTLSCSEELPSVNNTELGLAWLDSGMKTEFLYKGYSILCTSTKNYRVSPTS